MVRFLRVRNTIAYNLIARGLRRAIDILLVGIVVREIYYSNNISVYTLVARGRRINRVLRIEC